MSVAQGLFKPSSCPKRRLKFDGEEVPKKSPEKEESMSEVEPLESTADDLPDQGTYDE